MDVYDGPRLASPNALELVEADKSQEESKENQLIGLAKQRSTKDGYPFSHHDSLASNTNRSDKSKRAQPNQRAGSFPRNVGKSQESNYEHSKKDSISPKRTTTP